MESPRDVHYLYFAIAEDDIVIHDRLKSCIKQYDLNFIVTSVFNGLQLLDLLLKRGYYTTNTYRPPDVIILDLDMQLMDGLEALREIKKHGEIKNIPVYALCPPH